MNIALLLHLQSAALLACDPSRVNTDEGGEPDGPADDDVWDDRYVPEYRLTIPGSDWESALWTLHQTDTCEERAYTSASFTYDNPKTGETETYENVGVRYRGQSALDEGSDNRFGLKVAVNEYIPEQEFHGLHNLNFMGTEGDFSLLRERMVQSVMRDAGVPAPRLTHVKLWVNDVFYGVMPFPEEQDDDPYLDAHFDDDNGYLYKINGYCEGDGDFLYKGDNVDKYDGRYEAKADTPEEAYTTHLMPFLDCADDYSPSEFDTDNDTAMETCIESWIDVPEWLAEIAVDVAVLDVDGLQGTGQNFMLYWDPSIERFVVYPWDKDSVFRANNAESPGDDSIWRTFPFWKGEDNNLPPAFPEDLRRAYADEYCATVLDVAALTSAETLGAKLETARALLDGFILDDPLYGDEYNWEYEVDSLLGEITTRNAQIIDEAEICSPL